jgi:hypothetical protein
MSCTVPCTVYCSSSACTIAVLACSNPHLVCSEPRTTGVESYTTSQPNHKPAIQRHAPARQMNKAQQNHVEALTLSWSRGSAPYSSSSVTISSERRRTAMCSGVLCVRALYALALQPSSSRSLTSSTCLAVSSRNEAVIIAVQNNSCTCRVCSTTSKRYSHESSARVRRSRLWSRKDPDRA